MKIKEGFLLRTVAGSNIVVPIGAGSIDFSGVITLNEVGAFLWKLLEEPTNKEAMLEKLDMLMSTFFSEVGNELISQLSTVNKYKASTENLKSIKNWTENDFDNKLAELKDANIDFSADISKEDREEFL